MRIISSLEKERKELNLPVHQRMSHKQLLFLKELMSKEEFSYIKKRVKKISKEEASFLIKNLQGIDIHKRRFFALKEHFNNTFDI